MEKLYNEDGSFTKEGKARFLSADGTWTEEAKAIMTGLKRRARGDKKNEMSEEDKKKSEEAVKLLGATMYEHNLEREKIEQEWQDCFMNALEEAIKKEPKYNIYKNGNISFNYDEGRNLYFCFRIEKEEVEERFYLYKGVWDSAIQQIRMMRDCVSMNINHMISSLDYGKDDLDKNLNKVCWSFRERCIVEKKTRNGFYYSYLEIVPYGYTHRFTGTKEAYRELFKWKVLMIAYDRLLEWISDNEDKIKEVYRQLSE